MDLSFVLSFTKCKWMRENVLVSCKCLILKGFYSSLQDQVWHINPDMSECEITSCSYHLVQVATQDYFHYWSSINCPPLCWVMDYLPVFQRSLCNSLVLFDCNFKSLKIFRVQWYETESSHFRTWTKGTFLLEKLLRWLISYQNSCWSVICQSNNHETPTSKGHLSNQLESRPQVTLCTDLWWSRGDWWRWAGCCQCRRSRPSVENLVSHGEDARPRWHVSWWLPLKTAGAFELIDVADAERWVASSLVCVCCEVTPLPPLSGIRGVGRLHQENCISKGWTFDPGLRQSVNQMTKRRPTGTARSN